MDTATAAPRPFSFVNRGRQAPAVPSFYVATRHNRLNTSVVKVTPQADGMELVEYVGALDYNLPQEVQEAVVAAAGYGATGSRQVNYDDGRGVKVTWCSGPYVAPRRAMGTHRAPSGASEAQQALAKEQSAQGAPKKGDRWIVSELTDYRPIQNRPLEHRDCPCHNGTSTFHAGVVEVFSYWMDNSVDVTVKCEDGQTRTVQHVAPHGDVC